MPATRPNFIANRIGVYVMTQALQLMQEQGLTIEEVDALTGSALGWPRTGSFRLADMVGIDILAHVVANFSQSRAGESLELPPFVKTMLERRWLGDKTGQGFYKKEKDADGNEVRLALDWQTVAYRPATRPKFPSLELAKNAESLPERLRMLWAGDIRKDKAAKFQQRAAQPPLCLLRQLPHRDCRRSGQHRPRHAHRLQLGTGTL